MLCTNNNSMSWIWILLIICFIFCGGSFGCIGGGSGNCGGGSGNCGGGGCCNPCTPASGCTPTCC